MCTVCTICIVCTVCTENRELLSNAKKLLKMSKRKDYYKLLDVGKDASDVEIKKAYRKKALQCHPGDSNDPSTSCYTYFLCYILSKHFIPLFSSWHSPLPVICMYFIFHSLIQYCFFPLLHHIRYLVFHFLFHMYPLLPVLHHPLCCMHALSIIGLYSLHRYRYLVFHFLFHTYPTSCFTPPSMLHAHAPITGLYFIADRNPNATPEEKEQMEKSFKLVWAHRHACVQSCYGQSTYVDLS